jgi:hypothetical protein
MSTFLHITGHVLFWGFWGVLGLTALGYLLDISTNLRRLADAWDARR